MGDSTEHEAPGSRPEKCKPYRVWATEGLDRVTWLSYSGFSKADLTDAIAYSAKLDNCSFASTTLTKVAFVLANLSNADFTNADLSGANLSRAEITGAKFTDIRSDDGTKWPRGVAPDGVGPAQSEPSG